MGELSPVIEGAVKLREGKKWKSRFARVTRLSPVADFMSLQLWRDSKEVDRGGPTKGSINLSDYLGFESTFNLDKESHTLALIFQQMVVIIALPSREALIKWQVRLSSQFEEGQQLDVHLVSAPKKSKLSTGPMKIHLQNRRFIITMGIPPALVNSWNLVDMRRYGAVEGGRFCFEGGTRCGKGEGLHVFRVDNAEEIQIAFDLASKGKLENKKRPGALGGNFAVSASPSIASNLCSRESGASSDISSSSLTALLAPHSSASSACGSLRSKEDFNRTRSRSRSVNTSVAWSSAEGGLSYSSPDTVSLDLSEVADQQQQMQQYQQMAMACGGGYQGGPGGYQPLGYLVSEHGDIRLPSPEHLVNRKALLDRMGLDTMSVNSRVHASSRSCGSEADFYLHFQNHGQTPHRGISRQASSTDRLSLSSADSHSSGSYAASNYDQPKSMLKVAGASSLSSPKMMRRTPNRCGSGLGRPPVSSRDSLSPPLTPKSARRVAVANAGSAPGFGPEMRRVIAAAPCGCGGGEGATAAAPQQGQGYENYDIPRNLGIQEAMQFYDTPRNIREAMAVTARSSDGGDGMGNYDIPNASALPVFRKPCGCVMRLTTQPEEEKPGVGGLMTWTCVREGPTGPEESEVKIPRMKLTGHGKMPVVDMRKLNSMRSVMDGDSRATSPLSSGPGLPPKPPVYAQIDRSKKACPACTNPSQHIAHRCHRAKLDLQETTTHTVKQDAGNYTNLEFAKSLPLYENSRDVLSRLEELPQQAVTKLPEYSYGDNVIEVNGTPCVAIDNGAETVDDNTESADYLSMTPVNSESMPETDYEMMHYNGQPLNPFPPLLMDKIKLSCESMDSFMCDSRFNTIKEMPKNIIKIDEETLMVKPSEIYPVESMTPTSLSSGYVTIPRSRVSDHQHPTTRSPSVTGPANVTMRRSASVPCKRVDRNSTSSGGSDSGVSTGSPRQSQYDFSSLHEASQVTDASSCLVPTVVDVSYYSSDHGQEDKQMFSPRQSEMNHQHEEGQHVE